MTKKLIPYDVTRININDMPGFPKRVLGSQSCGLRDEVLDMLQYIRWLSGRPGPMSVNRIIPIDTVDPTFFMGIDECQSGNPWWLTLRERNRTPWSTQS